MISSEDTLEAGEVQKAQRDPAAFAALYRRYVAPIYRYVYSRLGNRNDAEDLTSQVFTEALASLAHYREQGTFAAWLFTIAARRIVDHYRQTRPHLPLDAALDRPADGHSPLGQVIHNEKLAQLAGQISRLNEDKQELLRLRFAGGLTYGAIGHITGRSEAAVKMAMNRLLRQLQAMVAEAALAEKERDADERR